MVSRFLRDAVRLFVYWNIKTENIVFMQKKENRIIGIRQETDHSYVNYYSLRVRYRSGREADYFIASRARDSKELKLTTGRNDPDGVLIYAVCRGETERVVLIRQFRYSLGEYVYEFPAGLLEAGETITQAAGREFFEETGMRLEPIDADDMYTLPRFTTVGMTDESCATVFGYASGEPSASGEEASEDISVVLADRDEVRRILREEKVAAMCAYMLMHFIHDSGDPLAFVRPEGE